jgi:hypothetical protein
MIELIVFLIGAGALAIAGIRVGMLLAPRFEHWGEPPKEPEVPSTDDDQP